MIDFRRDLRDQSGAEDGRRRLLRRVLRRHQWGFQPSWDSSIGQFSSFLPVHIFKLIATSDLTSQDSFRMSMAVRLNRVLIGYMYNIVQLNEVFLPENSVCLTFDGLKPNFPGTKLWQNEVYPIGRHTHLVATNWLAAIDDSNMFRSDPSD